MPKKKITRLWTTRIAKIFRLSRICEFVQHGLAKLLVASGNGLPRNGVGIGISKRSVHSIDIILSAIGTLGGADCQAEIKMTVISSARIISPHSYLTG
ncbi:hypothetical protein D0T21_20555 [Duganella sp. BJB476]|nr:hypothetical protein D0T21_20555 [Duganella sp. BJB476]